MSLLPELANYSVSVTCYSQAEKPKLKNRTRLTAVDLTVLSQLTLLLKLIEEQVTNFYRLWQRTWCLPICLLFFPVTQQPLLLHPCSLLFIL